MARGERAEGRRGMSTSGRSPAETLLAVQLEQDGIHEAGRTIELPVYEREFRFAPPRRWRADFMIVARPTWNAMLEKWDTNRILVEIDGGGYVAGRHSRGAGIEKDAEKQSAAAILGYRVIRVTPRQVEDGRALLWIRAALGLEEAA